MVDRIREMLDGFAAQKRMTQAQRDAVKPSMLARFLSGEVGQRLLRAGEVHREWSFNVTLRADEALSAQEAGRFGGVELLVVFDDVFIPNENIYMNGESEFATVMVERFAGYHRQSYGGCKVGVGDVLIGAAAVAADYNGVAKASHIKDKLIEMIHLNETMYSCGIACSAEGTQTASGNYLINLLLANVCKPNVTRFPYEMARIAEDLAGGAVGTCLSEADLHGEFTGPWVEKYMKNGTGTTAENRMRILRLIENLSLGAGAVGYRTESLHGAGSPQAQRVMIARQGDIAGKKVLAKRIARVKED